MKPLPSAIAGAVLLALAACSAPRTSEDATLYATPAAFTLTSPVVSEGESLPAVYTCDGTRATLPLAWGGAPAGTQGYALIMHHVAAPDDLHWYWIVYDIPSDLVGLAQDSAGVGILGTNSVNGKTEYAPPCSKGPGEKTYTYTLYALSAQPQLTVPPAQVSRDVLLRAIEDITLDRAELHVTYSR
jgi:phosphatidylethanolamine-binding protein (PEBP) family uncharacterized protein